MYKKFFPYDETPTPVVGMVPSVPLAPVAQAFWEGSSDPDVRRTPYLLPPPSLQARRGLVFSAGLVERAGSESDLDPDGRGDIRRVRAERYALLSSSRALLLAEGKRLGLQYPSEFHKTAKCLHVMRAYEVTVHKSKKFAGAFYGGLVTCGSSWACPVCAAKIQERRRLDVSKAMDLAYEWNLQPVMVTLTFPHRSWHSLSELLERQSDALARLREGNPWTKFKNRHGFIGLIRSLELTYGKNGWHPHTHELWFVSRHAKADDMREKITARWESMCIKAGLLDPTNEVQVSGFREHAVHVKGWCSNSEYLAKMDDPKHWGIDRELVKASTKLGKSKGIHPFGLLANYSEKDKKSGALFLEYVIAMRGKAQLFWSHGLKDVFGVKDKSDEEVADEKKDEADVLGRLDSDDWQTVRDAKAQASILDAAERGGWPAVVALLERLTLLEIERLERLEHERLVALCEDTS